MSEIITYTLTTSQTLAVPMEANFGDIINGGLLLLLVAVIALDFITFRLVKR